MKTSFSPAAVLLLAVFCLNISPAHAALIARAFVSRAGVDAAGCGKSASPCRTFQYAVTNIIQDGGEIDVMNAAEYGPVAIPKGVSIVNDGAGVATITVASGGTGITVNAGPNAKIFLKGLTIEGFGVGTTGIQFNSGVELSLENSSVHGFSGFGVKFTPSAGHDDLTITDSRVSYALGGSVFIRPTSGAGVQSTLKGSTFDGSNGSTSAVTLDGSGGPTGYASSIISNCVIRDMHNGVLVLAQPSDGFVDVTVDRSVVAHTDNALVATGSRASIFLNSSLISHSASVANGTAGGSVYTFGNNGITIYGALGTLIPFALH